MSTSPKRAMQVHLPIVQACAVALLAGLSLVSPGLAQADCWKHTTSLCSLVLKYGIQYSGGTCPGFYDVSFVFKESTGSCGGAIADLWSVSGMGTGFDEASNIVRVFPNDPYCQGQPFTANIKVKAYDALGTPSRTGTGPSPYVIDPSQFNQNVLALRCDPCQIQPDGTNPSCVPDT
jgi:hypothetical protein